MQVIATDLWLLLSLLIILTNYLIGNNSIALFAFIIFLRGGDAP